MTRGFSTTGLVVIGAICGCEDVDWNWELQEWRQVQRPIRPTRRRAPEDFKPYQARVETDTQPIRLDTGESVETGRPPPAAPQASERPEESAPKADQGPRTYHKLYLVSVQASMKAPPNSKKIRLKQAESRSAVDALNMIYPSIGPSGGEGQRFLVYQHAPIWSAASEFAPLLDCSELAKPPAADPTDSVEAFQTGVGLLYQLRKPGQRTDFEGFKRIRRLMSAAIGSDQASGQVCWGAAMLSGRIAAETLSDYAQARRCFERAKGFALPGSVEDMIAVYCLADTCAHEGKQDQAIVLARGLMKQFASHRTSYVYERAVALTEPR